MKNKCLGCGAALKSDDIGATKKLINRGAEEYFCIDCLAKQFGVDRKIIEEKIAFWKESGCLLFEKE